MYFYLLMAAVVAFGTWLIRTSRSRGMSYSAWRQEEPAQLTPQEKAAQWKSVGKILVVVAVMLGVIISTSLYSQGQTKLGITAYNQGRYAAAETDLRQADNFFPSEAEPHYYLALCLLHDGKKEAALREFQSVSSIVAHERTTGPNDKQYAAEAQSEIQQLGGQP